MTTRFTQPHLDLSQNRVDAGYQAPRRNRGGGSAPRNYQEHGARVQRELESAFQSWDQKREEDHRAGDAEGVYVEVELYKTANPNSLEAKRAGIKPGAAKALTNDNKVLPLFVPDDAREAFNQILTDYRSGPEEGKDNPPNAPKVDGIEAFREARLSTFWTDDIDALPEDPRQQLWWEIWCFKGGKNKLLEALDRIGARPATEDRWLFFPETTVIPVLTDRVSIELLLFATGSISELRRASATPTFFIDDARDEQGDWTTDLAERVVWPGNQVPAVCLLDTGVNRAHVLLEPALSETDMHSVSRDWGVADFGTGHGTQMAGLSLFGDLTAALTDTAEYRLQHRLESVKILPSNDFDPNDPRNYGAVTQSAISLPSIQNPDRARVFALTVTNEDISGERPTTWSAAIDQAAAGMMIGDEETAPKRLIFVSTGNTPAEIEIDRIISPEDAPIEDPAQAWNALTVGGYTDLIEIDDDGLDGWQPLVEAGELSPFSRTSGEWHGGKTPFKPDIVLEAGNRALSPAGRDVVTTDSLSLLTTGLDLDRQPLETCQATSAATAQAARMGARIMVEHPDYWPETIRALMVHSAEWTQPMRRRFDGAPRKTEAQALLRNYGYGVPDYNRAIASAQNHLALVSEATIQPFQSEGGRKFRDCHYYPLPWPVGVLEELQNTPVRLRVTLSYFVEPNPGRSAALDPQWYQSFGLRFDLKRQTETRANFIKRVNALERADPSGRGPSADDDPHWRFGPKSVSAGSLHCDEWVGPAVNLAARNALCVYPVTGWWKTRGDKKICNKLARYSLVLTLSTPDTEIDLYTPISTLIGTEVDIEVFGGGDEDED